MGEWFVGVAADGVATGDDLLDQVRIPVGLATDDEESGGNAVLVQQIQQAGRDVRIGAVIKGQGNAPLRCGNRC